jgi:Domain of unknown function (DUF4169)
VSAEVVNLRLARKRRERSAKEEEAAQNRLLHGETKAARTYKRLTAEKAKRDLDARKLDASRELSPTTDETL